MARYRVRPSSVGDCFIIEKKTWFFWNSVKFCYTERDANTFLKKVKEVQGITDQLNKRYF